jgi:hypothetical protein
MEKLEAELMIATIKVMTDRRLRGLCPECGKRVLPHTFREVLDLKEFEKSGLCQECIDKPEYFGKSKIKGGE